MLTAMETQNRKDDPHMNLKKLLPLTSAVLFALTGCAANDPAAPSATGQPGATQPAASQRPTIQDTITAPDPAANTASQSAALVDGAYTARTSDEYTQGTGHGWQEYLTITVENGQIVQLDYDALQDNKLKSETTPDVYPMTPHPSQWIPQLEASMMQAATAADIDAVTGATNSSRMAQKLYAAVMEAAQEGAKGDLIVE